MKCILIQPSRFSSPPAVLLIRLHSYHEHSIAACTQIIPYLVYLSMSPDLVLLKVMEGILKQDKYFCVLCKKQL